MGKKKRIKLKINKEPNHIYFKKFGISLTAPIVGLEEWFKNNRGGEKKDAS